jgi:hypothetical protein
MLVNPVLEIHACPPKLSLCSRHPYFFPAFTFAHLALCAAAILFLPAAEIVRFTIVMPVATGCDSFRVFAHRAFCAMLIRRRADADKVRRSFDPELPKAASAEVKR